jgi:hypothetical protein
MVFTTMKKIILVVTVCMLALGWAPSGMAQFSGSGEVSVKDKDVVKAAQAAVKARQEALNAEGKSAMITISKIMAAQQRASLPYPVYDFHFIMKVGSEEREAYATVARWSTGEYELISWTD